MKFLKSKFYNINSKRGFTLVETLVSLFIFSLSITAIIVVTGKGVADTTIAKNKITAVALAQEGIEIVRNIRDTYSLSEANPGEGWADFVDDFAKPNACGPNGCFVNDVQNYEIPSNSSNPFAFLDKCGPGSGLFQSGCDFLTREVLVGNNINTGVSTLGFYDYSNIHETPFKRTLYIECVDSSNCVEVRVESLVEWRQGTVVTSVNSVEYLFNWFKTVPATTTP